MITLAELRAFVAERHETMLALDRQLAPFWNEERDLRDLLICTHHWVDGISAETRGIRASIPGSKYVVAFCPENRAMRPELFAALDRLTKTWAPIRARRREVRADIDAAMRIIEHLAESKDKKDRRAQLSFQLSH